MRTSHREIKRRINNETANITDKELFSSSAFSAYLTDMAETVSGRYNRKMRVSCFWDTSESAFIANTDNKVIRINTGNFITQSFPTRVLKADSIIGLAAHELGHILYTSFELNNLCINKMKSGLLYPKELEIENTFDMTNAEEYKNMLSGSDKLCQNALITIFHSIVNILEDKYIEEKMSTRYSGRFAKGIMLNNIRYSEIIPSVSDQIKGKAYNFSILANMFIQYCKNGDINNRDDYDGEIMEIFLDCVPEIDNAVQDEDMRERFNCANIIMVKAWKYVKEILENVKEEEENGGYAEKTLENDLNEQIASYIGIPDADYSPIDEKKADRTHERIKLKKTENFSSDGSGNVSINNDYEGSETSKERKIDCILTEIAEEKVSLQTEMELTEELQKEADRIDYGNAHKDIDIVINRLSYIPEKYVEDYNAFAKPLLYLSKQLQKQTARFLNDKHFYGKISGLLMGRRIEPRLLNNKEGRIFSKKVRRKKELIWRLLCLSMKAEVCMAKE